MLKGKIFFLRLLMYLLYSFKSFIFLSKILYKSIFIVIFANGF